MSWSEWTADPSDKVFATGVPVFPAVPHQRSQFWRVGGPRTPVHLSGCAPRPSVPTPVPPIPPIPPMPPTSTDTLLPGQNILPDKPLVSQDRRFRLLYQLDGNLVLYGPRGPLWDTGTNGQSVGFVSLQGDGNLVIYNRVGQPAWASHTNGKPVQRLLVQNDGNVVLYTATSAVWSTGTVYVPPIDPTPPPGPIVAPVPIRVDGLVFRRPDNTIYNSRGTTAFLDLRRLLEGDEAGLRADYKKWYALGNRERRVFSRVNWNGNPGPGLFPERYPNYWQGVDRLFTLAAEEGFYIEIVSLTGTELGSLDAMADWCRQIEQARRRHVNVFHQLANEPPVNGIDIQGLVDRLDTSDWTQPWDTGQYYPTGLPKGSYTSPHTDRVDGWEWVRKAIKDILEYREGGGPYEPTDPAMHCPVRGGEPMGADSVYVPGRRDNVPVHHFTAAAGSNLFGAGYCVHSQSGLTSVFPEGVELECIAAAFQGMDAVDPKWQLGEYGRVGLAHFPITDDPSVRTYGMRLGNRWKVVRVGPTTPLPVVAPGWRVDSIQAFAGLNVVLELVQG